MTLSKVENLNIIVTGGAGFIGSALVRHLVANTCHNVLNIDNLTYAGNKKAVEICNVSPKYHFVKQDICNQQKIEKLFFKFKPNLVIHLAAESHVDRSIKLARDFLTTNIIGTYCLLEASVKYLNSIKDKKSFRFHHISTDEVFGDLPHPDEYPDAQNSLFTEESIYNPSSPYSASKASADHLVRAWHTTYNLPIVITNCSNNYGPFQYPEKLIPLCIKNALTGKDIPVYGNGKQIRDWLYVEDHIDAILTVAINGINGESYNIGGFNEIKNIDVVNTICRILDQKMPKSTSYTEQIKFVADRPGHDQRYAIDATKIKTELNWNPKETFESGIEKTVDWYLNNSNWINKRQGQ